MIFVAFANADSWTEAGALAAELIPNYAEKRRYREQVAFVESTINVVVGKRCSKRQKM